MMKTDMMEDTGWKIRKNPLKSEEKLGIMPFCITVDLKAKEYLPYLLVEMDLK